MKGMGNMMKQAQKLQAKMMKMQEELGGKTVEATSGGGMVKVVANGKQQIVSIQIEKEVVDPDDVVAGGQPVLLGTISIEQSEIVANLLKKRGIDHEVLNAKAHAREADIVAQAGRPGAVTVATNMAGRGVDIQLGGNPEALAKIELKRRGEDPESEQYLDLLAE